MGITGYLILLLGAAALGIAAHGAGISLGMRPAKWTWLMTAIAALMGGLLGTSALETWSEWGPNWDGLYVLPALIAAVIVGAFAFWRYNAESPEPSMV